MQLLAVNYFHEKSSIAQINNQVLNTPLGKHLFEFNNSDTRMTLLKLRKGQFFASRTHYFWQAECCGKLAAQRNPIKSTINQSNRLLKIFCSVSTDFHYFQKLQKIRSKTSVVKFFSSKALAQTFKLALKILLNRARLQMFSSKFSETLRTVVKNTCYIPLTTW